MALHEGSELAVAKRVRGEERLRMENETHFVEMPRSMMARRFLEALRKGRGDIFKGCRIKEVVQSRPDEVKVGVLHTRK